MNEKTEHPLADVHGILEKMEKVPLDGTFAFDCHKGLSCWTDCCSNPNLFLTPYDALRLRTRLGIKSGDFLETHTNAFIGKDFGLPVVTLRMKPDGRCPFVSGAGCGVYDDRPTTCRSYPIGQAASSGTETKKAERLFFKVKEDHCLGWNEPKEWTLTGWFENQNVMEYNVHNEFSVFLAFHPKLGDPAKLDEKKTGMIFMALYDLDMFREFVLGSSLLERIEVEPDMVENIKANDKALLEFGMRWIEFSVLGAPSFKAKNHGSPAP